MSTALERYYNSMDNVVLRDDAGNPSVFVKHYRQNSSDFDPSLPNHPHPAFVYGQDEGGNDIVDDAVLIGKYQNSRLSEGGVFCSLPGVSPSIPTKMTDINGSSHKIPANHADIGALTIYDYGLLVLTAHQLGIRTFYSENNDGYDFRDATMWEANRPYKVGDRYGFRGDLYECLKAHTPEPGTMFPSNTPGYWKKIKHIGGTVDTVYEEPYATTSPMDRRYGVARSTLTGSGPVSWYLNGDIWRETDFISWTMLRGIRLVKGQIQLLPNEIAADPNVDMKTTQEWRAILPHQDDTGHTLVDPSTEGTVHFYISGGAMKFVGRDLEASELTTAFSTPGVAPVIDSTTLPYVPAILYELGIIPIPGTTVPFANLIRARNMTAYVDFGFSKGMFAKTYALDVSWVRLADSSEAVENEDGGNTRGRLRARLRSTTNNT